MRAEGTKVMVGGGIRPGTVATDAGLPVAEGGVVVVEVTELRSHESIHGYQGRVHHSA